MSFVSMENGIAPAPEQNGTTMVARHRAIYYPDIWGDRFLDCTSIDKDAISQLEQVRKQLKEEVQKKLWCIFKNPKEMLVLIDDIERLGVAYHFEEEIETYLQNLYEKNCDMDSFEDDLHFVSMRFRLLRQHGFPIPCDVFEKFKNEKGSFKEAIKSDIQGILHLYEASHLRVHGENILDEAVAFTTTQLKSLVMEANSALAAKITHALKIPLHRRTIRQESEGYITVYGSDPLHDATLLRFAKLDFNLLQILYRKELGDLIRWWKSLDCITKLPYARDRVVEAYYWMLGVWHQPKYSMARIIITKLSKIISLIDDTYDVYATIQELELFTKAIERWDKGSMSKLPEYMKFLYQVTLDTIQEFEQELAKEGRSFAIYYMQQQMIVLCQAYFERAKWCHENYVPTYEEYMKNESVGSGYTTMLAGAYLGMGTIATKEAFEWINPNNSKAPRTFNIINRLLNDVGNHKFEQSTGQVASAVECYMVHSGLTTEEAYKEIHLHVEEAWKDINEEMLRPTPVPMPLLMPLLNFCRALYDIYQDGDDGYTMGLPLKARIEALVINPFKL